MLSRRQQNVNRSYSDVLGFYRTSRTFILSNVADYEGEVRWVLG